VRPPNKNKDLAQKTRGKTRRQKPNCHHRVTTAEGEAERRERARLRSERYRRAHGIGPRRPAQKPWLAEGVSRSTWYRWRKLARERAALAATFERAEAFTRQLQSELAEAARCQAVMAGIIGELAASALTARGTFT
jgi:hypothetical protein